MGRSPKPDCIPKVPQLMEIRSRRSTSLFSGLSFVFNGALSTFNAKDYVGVGETPNALTQNIFEDSFLISLW
jgi:hypothetical protein